MGKEFEVTIWENISHTVIVECESQDDAYEKAYEIITGVVLGDYDTDSDGFTGQWEIEEVG
jgi:hypothetical protein